MRIKLLLLAILCGCTPVQETYNERKSIGDGMGGTYSVSDQNPVVKAYLDRRLDDICRLNNLDCGNLKHEWDNLPISQ